MKFGGTSVRDHDRIRIAAGLVRDALAEGPVAVVVSALGGVTDQLIELARSSQRGESTYQPQLEALAQRHFAVVDRLEEAGENGVVRPYVGECLGELERLLAGVSMLRECSPRALDQILSSGERLSSHLMAAMLRSARRRRRGLRRPPPDRHRSLVRQRGGAVRGELRAHPRALRQASARCRW